MRYIMRERQYCLGGTLSYNHPEVAIHTRHPEVAAATEGSCMLCEMIRLPARSLLGRRGDHRRDDDGERWIQNQESSRIICN